MSRTFRRKGMSYFGHFGSDAHTLVVEASKAKTGWLSQDTRFTWQPQTYSDYVRKYGVTEKDLRLFHTDKHKRFAEYGWKYPHTKWMDIEGKVAHNRSAVNQKVRMAVRNETVDDLITDIENEGMFWDYGS